MPRLWLPTLLAAGLGSAALSGQPASPRPAPPPAGASQIDELVRQLADPDYSVRDSAAKELMKRWPEAVPAVRAASKSPDAEVARRAADILREYERRDHLRNLERIKAAVAAKQPDLLAELVARHPRDDTALWQAVSDFGHDACAVGKRVHGRLKGLDERALPSKDVKSLTALPELQILSSDNTTAKRGLVLFRGGSLSVDRSATAKLIAATGQIRSIKPAGSFWTTAGSVSVTESLASAVVVCDGDFELVPPKHLSSAGIVAQSIVVSNGTVRCPKERLRDSVVIAAGDVHIPEGLRISNSTILAGGTIHVPQRFYQADSELKDHVRRPTAPFNFFELSRVGLAVGAADGGVRVETVEAKSPLAAAGLLKGDLVSAVDGKKVESVAGFRKQVRAAYAAGDCTLTVRRGADARELLVRFPD